MASRHLAELGWSPRIGWLVLLSAMLTSALLSGCDSSASEEEAGLPGGRVPVVRINQNPNDCFWENRKATVGGTSTIEGTLICGPIEMSDPRVSGTEEWEMTDPYYIWYKDSSPNTGRFDASVVLTNEEGVWRGWGFGGDLWDKQGRLSTAFYAEYIGEGPYEGLVYREWGAQYPGSDGYIVSGYIEPAAAEE